MNDKGFTVVAFNRTTEKVDYFLANEAKGEFEFVYKFILIISFS